MKRIIRAYSIKIQLEIKLHYWIKIIRKEGLTFFLISMLDLFFNYFILTCDWLILKDINLRRSVLDTTLLIEKELF